MKRIILSLLIIALVLSGCQTNEPLSGKNAVTINLWHNYGGLMKDTMDTLIDEFNETVGRNEGIIINVTSITGSATIHEKLKMAVNDEPGAPDLPDITTLYPNTALMLAEKGLLADLESHFSKEDLSLYISEFVEEGRLPDGKLYVLPIGKSTEVMFLNTSIFNRFMKDADVSYNDLYTFEGILDIAEKYYEWTDNQTPNIENDGKAFINYDSVFNMAQAIYKQSKEDLIVDGSLNLNSPAFKDLWKNYFEPAVKGYVSIYDGYGSDLIKTGTVAANIGSTAGVLFYSDIVTYEDNTTEPAEFLILPYPVIERGEKIAIQRGGGMCIIKSDRAKENAAGIFLKWFTSPEQNLKFVSSTGYLPVTEKAVELTNDDGSDPEDKMRSLENTTKEMAENFNFFYTPVIDNFDELEDSFNSSLKDTALVCRNEYLNLLDDMDEYDAFIKATENKFEEFIRQR
ncbi:MAG: extracellular solute-binding protein [Bacillota bacterium]|jgi:multiple sugar transport system substrate-binding protein|nr:extracellular solute-binding protein [Bacillota bacterium]NLL60026.1 extracellular solute-binding protein [Tissierellia bacterium]